MHSTWNVICLVTIVHCYNTMKLRNFQLLQMLNTIHNLPTDVCLNCSELHNWFQYHLTQSQAKPSHHHPKTNYYTIYYALERPRCSTITINSCKGKGKGTARMPCNAALFGSQNVIQQNCIANLHIASHPFSIASLLKSLAYSASAAGPWSAPI